MILSRVSGDCAEPWTTGGWAAASEWSKCLNTKLTFGEKDKAMACVWLFDVLDTVSVTNIEQIGETLKLQAIKTEQVVYKRWFLKK